MTNTLAVFEFNGGKLITKGTTNISGRVFQVGNGMSTAAFQLLSGTHRFANALVISSNAALTGTGTIFGNVTNFGSIGAGNSAGSLRIDGSLSLQSSSMMSFEIGGLLATNEYDVLTVTNFVQFAGTLSLALLNNFLPDDSDTFTLLKFGSSSGSFANITGGRVGLTNNLASFAVTQTATNLVLGGVTYTDSDGDGQGDLQEQAAGTDPLVSASAMHITSITQNGSGHIVVQFQSVTNKTYRIEYSPNLATWNTATTNVPSAGASTQWIDDGSLTGGLNFLITNRFYRVGLQ